MFYYVVMCVVDFVELDCVSVFVEKIGNVIVIIILVVEEDVYECKGFVIDYFSGDDLLGGDCDVYLCGLLFMVDVVCVYFGKLGVEFMNFYYEKFNFIEEKVEVV